MKELGLFAAGVLFGTAGIKLLSSKDARKAYAHTTAAALRAKEDVMKTVTACGRARMTSTQKPRPSTSAAQRRRPPLWWRTLLRRKARRSDP